MRTRHPCARGATARPPHARRWPRRAWVLTVLCLVPRSGAADPLPPCPTGKVAREQQCLVGPVRRVAAEIVTFSRREGAWVPNEAQPSWEEPATLFDREGHVAEQVEHASDGTVRRERVFVYDRQRRLREILSFGTDGALLSRTVFTYDGRGRRTLENRFSPEGALRLTVAYAYDVLGRVIEETLLKDTGDFVLRWVYSYDETGNRIREALYLAPGVVNSGPASKSYGYAALPAPAEEVAFSAAGTVLERKTYEYDARGNRTQEMRYDAAGFLLGTTVSEYEFDGIGNWVKRTRVRKYGNLNVRPLDITRRTLTYFEPPAEAGTAG